MSSECIRLIEEKYSVVHNSVSHITTKYIKPKNQMLYFYSGLLHPSKNKVFFEVSIEWGSFSHPKLSREIAKSSKTRVISISQVSPLYPSRGDKLEEVYFCLPTTTLKNDEIPYLGKLFMLNNSEYSKVCDIVISHKKQLPWCRKIDLESNPSFYNKEIFLDEVLPGYIKNFNFESRMFLFLKKGQSITEAARQLMSQGANYCDYMSKQMNEEGIFTYMTSGHLSKPI